MCVCVCACVCRIEKRVGLCVEGGVKQCGEIMSLFWRERVYNERERELMSVKVREK